LPAGFAVKIDDPDDKPVTIGDYLDEEDIAPSRPTPRQPPAPQTPSETAQADRPQVTPAVAPAKEPPTPMPSSQAVGSTALVTASPDPSRKQRPKPVAASKRTRLNVSDTARDQLAGIVEKMARFGPEPDVRASEVLEAMIMALYEAREYLDLSNVQARGKWGTPTARAFPIALKQSVSRAMGEAARANEID
jgi:hypothetical protein